MASEIFWRFSEVAGGMLKDLVVSHPQDQGRGDGHRPETISHRTIPAYGFLDRVHCARHRIGGGIQGAGRGIHSCRKTIGRGIRGGAHRRAYRIGRGVQAGCCVGCDTAILRIGIGKQCDTEGE